MFFFLWQILKSIKKILQKSIHLLDLDYLFQQFRQYNY